MISPEDVMPFCGSEQKLRDAVRQLHGQLAFQGFYQ